MKDNVQRQKRKRAVLAGRIEPSSKAGFESMEELALLADTADAECVGRITQKGRRINPGYFFGRGKLDALQKMVGLLAADLVIFDDDLTPAQVHHLEETLKIKVIDRSELILDIFAMHARTKQAQTQVKLARLEYLLPRLKHRWTHFSQEAGIMGMRGGAGERQIEVDRRIIRRMIADCREDLREIEERRRREVAARSDEFTVSLVGYTNAGKTSLLNRLTGATELVEDKLFATLDTRTRAMPLGERSSALLSDTVGFIRKLPHHLVASFQATLEEVAEARLLLHVIDASSPEMKMQIRSVNEVLEEIGCRDKEAICVFNKVDKIADRAELGAFVASFDGAVAVSALTGEGLDRLRGSIAARMRRSSVLTRLAIPAGEGKAISYLYEHCHVVGRKFEEGTAFFDAEAPPHHLSKLRTMKGVRVLAPGAAKGEH